MVLEVALIDVVPGREDAFAAAYANGHELVASTPGCRSVRMTRGIESPSRFVLLVEWDTVEAHVENFRATERFAAWRALIGPYFAAPPHVEHFSDLGSGTDRPGRDLGSGTDRPGRELRA
jgi:heme-degrading monooxygenase HmoA